MSPYREGGVFRKYTPALGWFDFDSLEEGSSLRYALGELGFCPPPGSIQYQESPLIGANCLEVTLRDGGLHDSDGVRNGVVDDPAYMVYEDHEYEFSPPSVENKRVSGGALGLWWLCFSMLLLWRAQKRGALTRR